MSAIDTLGDLSSAAQSGSSSAFGELSSDEFMKLILTELQNQDPLEPQDTQALLEQLSTLRSIESDVRTADQFEELVNQNEFAAATTLIGSLVSGISTTGQRVADLVISVSIGRDGPVLNLFDGSVIPFNQVEEVVGPLNIPDGSDDGSGGDDGDGSGDGDGDGTGDPTDPALPDDMYRAADPDNPNATGSTNADGTGGTASAGVADRQPIDPIIEPETPAYTASVQPSGSVSGDRLSGLIDSYRKAFDARR